MKRVTGTTQMAARDDYLGGRIVKLKVLLGTMAVFGLLCGVATGCGSPAKSSTVKSSSRVHKDKVVETPKRAKHDGKKNVKAENHAHKDASPAAQQATVSSHSDSTRQATSSRRSQAETASQKANYAAWTQSEVDEATASGALYRAGGAKIGWDESRRIEYGQSAIPDIGVVRHRTRHTFLTACKVGTDGVNVYRVTNSAPGTFVIVKYAGKLAHLAAYKQWPSQTITLQAPAE